MRNPSASGISARIHNGTRRTLAKVTFDCAITGNETFSLYRGNVFAKANLLPGKSAEFTLYADKRHFEDTLFTTEKHQSIKTLAFHCKPTEHTVSY